MYYVNMITKLLFSHKFLSSFGQYPIKLKELFLENGLLTIMFTFNEIKQQNMKLCGLLTVKQSLTLNSHVLAANNTKLIWYEEKLLSTMAIHMGDSC